MNIANILVPKPTKAECDARTPFEKAQSQFDFYYETHDVTLFKGTKGEDLMFSSLFKEGAWCFSVNCEVVLTSKDAYEVIGKAAEYL
jgi:hypothetical protein